MLNRHEIGHAPASLASAKGKTVFINKARSEAVYACNRARSREPRPAAVLSEKRQSLCFSQVPAGSDCSLPCLYCFGRFTRLISTVLPAAGLQVPRDKIASLTDLLCINRFTQLISIVLPFEGLQVATSSDYLLPCLYCICRFDFLSSTVPHFVGYPLD